MLRRLPLDIAPDLTLTIGSSSVQVTPSLGMKLAQSLLTVSARQMVQQAAAQATKELMRTPRRKAAR